MGSLDAVNLAAFAPQRIIPQPSPLDYFQQGQQVAQSLIDQQYQAQTRQRLVEEQKRKSDLEALLGPIEVQSAQQRFAQSQALNPIQLQNAKIGLEQNQAELEAYKLNNAPLPYLGTGGEVKPVPSTPTGTVSNVAANPDGTYGATATVFAGPKDRVAYDRAIASGATEIQALAVGDNQKGAWGADTGDPTKKYVALSPDFLKANNLKANDPITVMANGKTSLAYVGDKLPNHSANGAGIDVNPGVAADLGVDPDNYKGPVTFKIGHDANASVVAMPASVPDANGMVAVVSPSGDAGFVAKDDLSDRLAGGYKLRGASVIVPSPVTSPGITSNALLSSGVSPISLDVPAFHPITSSPMPRVFAPVGNGQPVVSIGGPSVAPMQPGRGYIDPDTHQAVFQNDRRLVPPGATFGIVQRPIYSPTVAKQDARDLTMAENLGIDPTGYEQNSDDANGSLTTKSRTDLKRDIAAKNAELTKMKISEGADGQLHLSQDAIEDYAQRSLLDPSVRFAGLGKVAAGANIEIANRRAEIQRETGLTGTDAYVAQQGVAAAKLSLRDQEKKRSNIVGFEQTARENAKIALGLLDKGAGGSGSIPVFNRWLQAGRKGTGDPDVAAFNTAIGAFTNEYAKIISGNTGAGGATDSSRREAAELINKGGTVEQLRAQLDIAFQEMENRSKSIDGQIDRLNDSIRNAVAPKKEGASSEKPVTSAAPEPVADKIPIGKIAVQNGKRYQKQADGSWKEL